MFKKLDNGALRFSIFPTLVYGMDCSDLLDDVLDIFKKVNWKDQTDAKGLSVSDDSYILNNNKKLVETIEFRVNECLSEIEYTAPLKMTTSWFTRLRDGGDIVEHHHVNAFWSAVFYPFSEGCSSLTFLKNLTPINVPSNTLNPDLIMEGDVSFPIERGRLIIFPALLKHSVRMNDSGNDRNSLAMNFMPYGNCGTLDSQYHYR